MSGADEQVLFDAEAMALEVARLRGPLRPARLVGGPRVRPMSAAAVARRPNSVALTTPVHHKLRLRLAAQRLAAVAGLPTIQVEPVPSVQKTPAVVSGAFVLFPDARTRTVSFLLKAPRLVSASVLVERDSDFRTLGGAATLVTSVFPEEDAARLVPYHDSWAGAIAQAGVRGKGWRFVPLAISRIDAELDLPAAHSDTDVRVTASAEFGVATYLVELSPTGAQAWKDGFEQGAALPGVCRSIVSFSSKDSLGRPAARSQSVSLALESLAHQSGASAVRVSDPEIEVNAILVVDGHPTLKALSLEMRSSSTAAQTEVFGSEGGTMNLRITSSNLLAQEIEWSAQVSFFAASWPAVRAAGVLSSSSGWAELINPASWIRQVSVTTMLIGSDGKVVTESPMSDRVTGSLDFTADFLEGKGGLQTTFETTNEQTTTVLTTRPPGTEPGELKLTVVAFREGRDDLVVRTLSPDEQWVLVKVYPNARIEITSNLSPSSELDPVTNALAGLTPPAGRSAARPCIHAPPRRAFSARPPLFTMEGRGAPFWALEVATDPSLFLERNADRRREENYFSSIDDASLLLPVGATRLPRRAWQRLRGAPRLYYRGWTSHASGHWLRPQTTFPDAFIEEAPSMEVFSI